MLGGSSHKGTKHSSDCSETETPLIKNPELFSLNKKIQGKWSLPEFFILALMHGKSLFQFPKPELQE